MSEQENKSSVNPGSSMVVIEQAPERGHKQPYRPTELDAPDTELHHKRSKAPAVPAVEDDLKATEDTTVNVDAKDKRESELPSEKYKQTAVKKLPSTPNKRSSSPEIMVALDSVKSSANPMPAPLVPVVSIIDDEKNLNKIVTEKKSEEGSIKDEVSELRTAEPATEHSEWRNKERYGVGEETFMVRKNPGNLDMSLKAAPELQRQMRDMACSSNMVKKKEISWNDKDYLSRVELKEFNNQSQIWLLERKASVGPCKSRTAYQQPSGISISVPKKSTKSLNEDTKKIQSGINITFSKKCIPMKSRSEMVRKGAKGSEDETRAVTVDPDVPYLKMLGALRSKIDIVCSKIKNVING